MLVEKLVINFLLVIIHLLLALKAKTAQWRSDKTLDLRPIGRGFNSHRDKAA